jgi:hypothetical protein
MSLSFLLSNNRSRMSQYASAFKHCLESDSYILFPLSARKFWTEL